MATAYCDGNIISRSSGNSSVAASAYRSGEELHNEREGNTYQYGRKRGIVHAEILTPSNAPKWAADRAKLWNSVERIEKQRDAQLAREFVIALPRELSREQQIALAHEYARSFAEEGMVADLSIHDKGDGNPHAHILLTMRPFKEDGTWAAKCHKEYLRDEHGEKIRLKSGQYKSRKVTTTDWDTHEKFMEWRKRYETITNEHLAQAGSPSRISVESYEARGIDKRPMIHLGHYAHQLEQQGIASERGNINRHILQENRERETLTNELAQVNKAIEEERRRQELLKRKTLTEEQAQRKVEEWRREAQESLQQPTPEPSGWEDLKREASRREEARKRAEAEAAARRDAERKFVRQNPLQHPARVIRHKRRPRGTDWSLFAEGVQQARMRRGRLDWAKLARQAEERRIDWQQAAQAGRVDWVKLAEVQQRVDWQQLAREQEARRPDWQRLAEEARRQREQPKPAGGGGGEDGGEAPHTKLFRDLYNQGDGEYTEEQQQQQERDDDQTRNK